MRILGAVAAMVLLAAPAHAQVMPNINLIPEVKSQSPEEKEQDAVRDKAYKDSLRKIPDAKSSSDPWGTVRGTDAPKTTAPKMAAPKPKTKTGSNAQSSQ
jgi:hypothetical protein